MELKRDKSSIILTADNGITMVVMDRQEYIDKANNLLAQLDYRPIPHDPTNKIKAKLITILRKVKKKSGLDDSTNKYMYPTGCSAPKFYGLPKIYKPYTPKAFSVQQRISHIWSD